VVIYWLKRPRNRERNGKKNKRQRDERGGDEKRNNDREMKEEEKQRQKKRDTERREWVSLVVGVALRLTEQTGELEKEACCSSLSPSPHPQPKIQMDDRSIIKCATHALVFSFPLGTQPYGVSV